MAICNWRRGVWPAWQEEGVRTVAAHTRRQGQRRGGNAPFRAFLAGDGDSRRQIGDSYALRLRNLACVPIYFNNFRYMT